MFLFMFGLFFFLFGMYYGHLIESQLKDPLWSMLSHGNHDFDEKISMPEKSIVYFVIHGNPLDEEGDEEKEREKECKKEKSAQKRNHKK